MLFFLVRLLIYTLMAAFVVLLVLSRGLSDLHIAQTSGAILLILVLALSNVLVRPTLDYLDLPVNAFSIVSLSFTTTAMVFSLLIWGIDGLEVTNVSAILVGSLLMTLVVMIVDRFGSHSRLPPTL